MNEIKFKDADLSFNNTVNIYGYDKSIVIKSSRANIKIKPESRLELIKLRNYLDECIDNYEEE